MIVLIANLSQYVKMYSETAHYYIAASEKCL